MLLIINHKNLRPPAKPAKSKQSENIEFDKTSGLEILFRTQKGGILITDGDKIAWITSKMINSNGELTPLGKQALKKATQTLKSYQIDKSIKKKGYTIQNYTIEKQTDKAKCLKFSYQGIEINTWFPDSKILSQTEGEVIIDGEFWLAVKIPEIKQNLRDKESVQVSGAIKEFDNSFGINVSVYEHISEQSVSRKMFFPKKLVIYATETNTLLIPRWLLKKKIEEVKESCATNSFKTSTMEVEGLIIRGEEFHDTISDEI